MFCVFLHFFRNSANSSSDSRYFTDCPCSLVFKRIYHRSTSFPSKYTIESMVHSLQLPLHYGTLLLLNQVYISSLEAVSQAFVFSILDSFSCRHEKLARTEWTEIAQNWNESFTHWTSHRSGWPRELGQLNPSPFSWIFNSVSVGFSPRF